jgi:PAS domain S-box-containing protein
MAAMMGTSMAVLIVTCGAFIAFEIVAFRENMVRGLTTRAEIIAANSTAALAFANRQDATEVLAALGRDPHIVAAGLYDRDGRLFARYPADVADAAFPSVPERDGRHFGRSDFTLFRPVLQGERWLGTVYLKSDLSALTEWYRPYAVLVMVVFAVAVLLALALSAGLQKGISDPIRRLADTARQVSERSDYSLRTPKVTHDEIGALTDSFNDMLHEIQERETALQTNEGRLRAILESAMDCIITMDQDGRIVEFNPAAERLFGHTRARAVGSSLAELIIPPEMRERHHQGLARYLATGKAVLLDQRLELNAMRADGSAIPVEVTITRIAQPGPPMFTGFIRDIAERKRSEQEIRQLNADLEQRVILRTAELEASNRELEAFSYSVSHDLRAPLRAIDGFSKAILDECGDTIGDSGKSYLQRVRTATRQMGQLIGDLLNLARITRVGMRREPVDLSALATQISTELGRLEPGRNVALVAAEGMSVEGDPQLLRVAIDNLLRNAWKFTSKHPTARIELGRAEHDGRPVYFLSDDGAGFEMAHAKLLFEPFHRLHRQSEFEGTGVGLATVQRIIQRHRGRIWAVGAIERGATFYFTLWEEATA